MEILNLILENWRLKLIKDRYLILSDGSTFGGVGFGHNKEVVGEVVFNTSMTGYQEMLTDPSYGGQILTSTYPMIGNYGTYKNTNESDSIQVLSYLIRDLCEEPFHYENEETLDSFLKNNNIPGIHSIDTRSLARKIRNKGALIGLVTNNNNIEMALNKINKFGKYENYNYVKEVSTPIKKFFKSEVSTFSVAVIDFGVKKNIIRLLNERDCDVTVYPWDHNFDDIGSHNYNGILLSPGPGDPSLINKQSEKLITLVTKIPTLAICLGHQILAKAFGAGTFKLPFGHRGANQPVKDLKTKKIYPTAQNHGFAVDSINFPSELEVTHINLNDNTISGFRHKENPIISIQYHSEACPGPVDSEYIFDEFINLMKGKNA